MTISPRAEEVKAVQAILESEEYEDSKKMARAIVVAVAKELQRRSTLMVALQGGSGGGAFPVGPFYDKRSAEKWANSAAQEGWPVLGISPFGAPARTVHANDEVPQSLATCACGHVGALHDKRWGCCVYVAKKKQCECDAFALEGQREWLEP